MLAIVGVLFGRLLNAIVKINSHNIVTSVFEAVITSKLTVNVVDRLFWGIESLERVEADEEVVLGSSRDSRGSGGFEESTHGDIVTG